MNEPPAISRPEWKLILNDKIDFLTFAPRLMTDRLRSEFKKGLKSEDECINEMHLFFTKYRKAYKKDLIEVFKEW